MRYNLRMEGELWWDQEDAQHIRTRSARYPGAYDLERATDDARSARRARHDAIRAEVAAEEAEAAEAEAVEREGSLDIPLHLRITRDLDARLRREAEEEQIPTSALVRRLLVQALREREQAGLTEAQAEDVARRVVREEIQQR